jgi:hypothetical protein
VQTYRTIQDYREGHYPNLPFVARRRIYPAIVTLEDWYFFGHELPERLDAAVRADMDKAGLPNEWLEQMPYSIMSVDEFETAMGIMNMVGLHSFVSGKVANTELRRWAYDAYCKGRYKEQIKKLPPLFDDEYETLFAAVIE